MAGLTPNGLEVKRLLEILEDLSVSQRLTIDPDLITDDSTVLGQYNNIIAAAAADGWQLAQAVHDNSKVLKAEGVHLDDLVVLNGVYRTGASESFVEKQRYYGEDNTLIPPTVILENPITLDRFSPVSSITLTAAACISCTLSVATLDIAGTYTVSVDGVTYTSTADTIAAILLDITAQISANTTALYTATYSAADQNIVINSVGSPLNVTASVLFSIDQVSAYGLTRAAETGALVVPAGVVNTIVVGTSGLVSTVNEDDYIEGVIEEDDEALRARFLATSQRTGSATVRAIEDTVASVAGVTSAVVIENDDEFPDSDGRPPRSFEVISQGGLDIDVANAIWDKKAVGIKTYGNIAVEVLDHRGLPQIVNLTRPAAVFLAVRVTYSLYAEETISPTVESSMAGIVEAQVNALDIDQDVIPRRLLGPIYAAEEGIDFLNIQVQVLPNSGDTPDENIWQDVRLPIAATQFARTTTIDITFNGV